MRLLVFLGLIGHPLYYYVWSEVLPQAYEEVPVRLAGVIALIIWWLWDRREKENHDWFVGYSYFTLMISTPFLFFYMFLQNDASGVWLGSLICGIFYLALIINVRMLLVTTVSGFAFAAFVYTAQGGEFTANIVALESIPVILFALVGGIIFKYAEEMAVRNNKDKAVALAGSVAHEIRTPLMGILLELDDVEHELQGRKIGNPEELNRSLNMLRKHLLKSQHVVDCMLQNVRDEEIDTSKFQICNMAAILSEVVEQYPLMPSQRALVSVNANDSYEFWGDNLLMAHVLINLLKNALAAIAAAGKGNVIFTLKSGAEYNQLTIRDTGIGIDNQQLGKIFSRFYSNTEGGAGLGLAYCSRAVKSMGGRCSCTSEPGKFTEFQIMLPALNDKIIGFPRQTLAG